MEGLTSPTTIKALLEEFGLAPLKKLGQNFLRDDNIVKKIAQSAVMPGECVLEIGPGLGALSHELACRARRLVCVEIDAGMVRALSRTLAEHENAVVLHEDFLKTDIAALGCEYFGGEPFAVCGNLPYYITARCIMNVLEAGVPLLRFTAMVQKEVAARLAAAPGSGDYGALTAAVSYFGEVSTLFGVSRSCFLPAPEVDSAVIQLSPGEAPEAPAGAYLKTVRALFAKRRKTAQNNLRMGFGIDARDAERLLGSAGLALSVRAEQISPEQFVLLCNALLSEGIISN